ncbi:unnamed protein product, partial [Rotaria sp. Silwood2]
STISQKQRVLVKRIDSPLLTMADTSTVHSTKNMLDTDENTCHICYGNIATHEYKPCQHFPICEECFAKLTEQQHEECLYCHGSAKIHPRVLNITS